MKKLFFYLLFILICKFSLGQFNEIKSSADTCTPDFKEVYNFQIGDVFQYVEESSTSIGGLYPTTKITSKYSIESKTANGDTLMYSISGIRRTDSWCAGNPTSDPICDPSSYSEFFNETLVYIDSAMHFLNRCKDELVSGFSEDINSISDSVVYTKIQIQIEDTNHVKIIGGPGNLFTYNANDSLITIDYAEFKDVYARNLGKISHELWFFEVNESKYLQGYINNGDTTGVISPDENLIVSTNTIIKQDVLKIYPNPTDGVIFLSFSGAIAEDAKIEIFDIAGKMIMAKNISDSYIDLSAFNRGIYFLKVSIYNNIITKKVILN